MKYTSIPYCEGEAAAGIVSRRVDTRADRCAAERAPRGGMQARHDPVGAHREEMPPVGIEGEPRRLFAAGDRPDRQYAQLARIEHGQAVPVLEVHVDTAPAVRHGELGPGIEGERADDLIG